MNINNCAVYALRRSVCQVTAAINPPVLNAMLGIIKIRKKAPKTVIKLSCGSDFEFGIHNMISEAKTTTAHSSAAIQ